MNNVEQIDVNQWSNSFFVHVQIFKTEISTLLNKVQGLTQKQLNKEGSQAYKNSLKLWLQDYK